VAAAAAASSSGKRASSSREAAAEKPVSAEEKRSSLKSPAVAEPEAAGRDGAKKTDEVFVVDDGPVPAAIPELTTDLVACGMTKASSPRRPSVGSAAGVAARGLGAE
jgi:hypothetical protein